MSKLPPRPAELQQELADLIVSRRTIHRFQTGAQLDPERMRQAIEVACWAPNHRDTEPWRFYLVGPESSRGIVERNAELVSASKGAAAGEAKRKRWATMPGWLLVNSLRHGDPLVARENYAATCCAIQNLSLVLWSQGVGLKWGTGPVTRDAGLARLLGFDPGLEETVGLFWYGYPEDVPHKTRRPLEQVLRELP